MSSSATGSGNTHDGPSGLHSTIGLPASLSAKENITLLALALVLSVAYIVQQSIRQRVSEKRAFERKRRLLGISTTAASNSTASNYAGGSTAEGKDAALSTRAISSISTHAWTLSQLLHLDACVQYVQEATPSTLKRLLGQKTRRRKDTVTANGASDSATSASAKDTRGRAGTINTIPRTSTSSSSPSQAQNKSPLPTMSHTPSSPHSPAGRQSARTAQAKHVSGSANASSSSSRSRSSTQTSKQQQQRTSHPAAAPTVVQANQPVMKHVGIQVSFEELSDSILLSKSSRATQQVARPQGKGKKARTAADSSAQLPNTSIVLPSTAEGKKTELDMASRNYLPSDNVSFDTSEDISTNREASNEVTHTLSRNGTITYRTSRSTSRSSSIMFPHVNSVKNPSLSGTYISSTPPSRSNTKESGQSPTCSSSGRSTSLSVSTDATDMTSLRDDQEASSTAAVVGTAPGNSDASPSQFQRTLQPAAFLVSPKTTPSRQSSKAVSAESLLQKSPVGKASMLSYSFHAGFQEPTTLEEGEIDKFAGPMTSSPSQPRRQDGTDTSCYPSIPILPSTSSASSSAYNSPSSARRDIAMPRHSDIPSSSTLPQSPANERMPENAHINKNMQSGMYQSSLGVQSSTSYGFMPTSPPPHAAMQHQQQASPGGTFGRTAAFHGLQQSSPQSQPAFVMQQQQHMHHYIAQAQYPYQHLLQQQQIQPAASSNGNMHDYADQSQSHARVGFQSPALANPSSSGLLNPMNTHPHGGQAGARGNSSSGGSNRSSVHLASPSQVSSRSTSPQPSWAHSLLDAHEGSTGASTAPTEADNSHQAYSSQQQQFANGSGQNQQMHEQTQMDFVQKMMFMQAQIQFAMQQNEVQSQHAQAQAQAHAQAQAEHHFLHSTAEPSIAVMSAPRAPLSPAGQGLPSPFLQTEGQQQSHSPFLLTGLASPLTSGMYHYQPVGGQVSPGVTSPYQQYPPQYLQHHHAGGPLASTSSAGARTGTFPTVRRRQSTPALGADATIPSFGPSQGFTSGSPFPNGKRRNRRNSRISRMSSYGQALDSPDYSNSLNHDTSTQYDAEVDMSTTSSSYNPTQRPNYDRRRSSLIPPSSPLLNPRKERRSRQREREREKARQMELDDEDVTNNEDDIKADLELLAQMQEKVDQDQSTAFSTEETMKRIKSMETVLERRGKELEIARWKLKCVEVDRRNIEAEHQKALAHFYDRAERAEARLRLVDNATTASEGANEKSSPEVSTRPLHDATSWQGDGSVRSEASQAGSDAPPSLSISFSSTTPHLAYSTGYCSPTDFNSASYHFSDSPYNSSKYPPHPFASGYKNFRKGKQSSRNPSLRYTQTDEIGDSTLSPRSQQFVSLTSPSNGHEDTRSSEDTDSNEDVEIVLDSSYSRSPSIHPSVPHSRVPSGGLLDSPAVSSVAMTENKTVGLGIESPSASSDGSKPSRKATVDFVGSLPSFTISQPPASPSSADTTEKS